MRNREQYQDFLKCLSLFSEDIISKQELISLMMDSLSRHPDLQVCCPCWHGRPTTSVRPAWQLKFFCVTVTSNQSEPYLHV